MIAETVARLIAEVPDLAMVSGAAEFQRVAESSANPKAVPAAFVLPQDELPGARRFSGDDIQKVSVSMAIVLVIRNVTDTKGGAALDALKPLRDAVKLALLGWVPVDGYTSLSRGQASLLAFRDGHLWWQDTYYSSFFERKP